MNDAGQVWSALTFGVILFALYFLPTGIALRKSQFGSVLAINLFLGWTLVGWVIALAWAAKNDTATQVIIQQSPPILCPSCGKYSHPTSNFCNSCGQPFARAAIAR